MSHQVLNLSKQLQDIKSQRPLHQPWTTAAKVEVGSASVTSAWAPLGISSSQPGPSIASWQTPTPSRRGILAGHQHLHWSNIQQVLLIKEDQCRQCYLNLSLHCLGPSATTQPDRPQCNFSSPPFSGPVSNQPRAESLWSPSTPCHLDFVSARN